MYRQSAYGRVALRRGPSISVPENYSGNAFKHPQEPPRVLYEAEPSEKEEICEALPEAPAASSPEEKKQFSLSSLFSGIGEKLNGDGLLLLLVLLILIGGGGKRDDGALAMILILLLI